MDRLFFIFGSLFALLGVVAGAFGGHLLQERLPEAMQRVFEVGVRYQMYHALGLLAAAWAVGRFGGGMATAAGWCFVGGIVIFSGSLYLLALSGTRGWGAVTPIGGLLFILGWLMLALAAWHAQ